MKVAIFTDNDFSKINGVTTTLRAVLAHAPADIRLRIYTCESHATDTADYFASPSWGIGIPFYREMRIYLPSLRRFIEETRKDGVDLVHLTTPGPVGLAALHVAAQLRLPMIGSFHTDLAEYTRLLSGSASLGRLMQQYMRWPYGRCQHILVPSLATRETMVKTKIDPSKISLWQRGVCTDVFTPAKRSAALRRQWDSEDGQLVLLYVGRVSKEKGLDLLPALTERLRRSHLSHRLVVVGDGPMRAELQGRCPGAVFTRTLAHADVAAAMASADLFVFPSRTDTAGNVVLEAQASGLPVLVTNHGGPQENMIDGETGHVCADLPAFTQRISELTVAPQRRLGLGVSARRYAQTRSWAAALEPLYRVYRTARANLDVGSPFDAAPALISQRVA